MAEPQQPGRPGPAPAPKPPVATTAPPRPPFGDWAAI